MERAIAGLIRARPLLQLGAVLLVAWAATWLLRSAVPVGRDIGANAATRQLLAGAGLPSRPVADPTLTVAVITDYRCPACRGADAALHAAAARDGHVRIVYVDWPILGSASERAARVALAADRQGIYPALHRRLMAERRALTDPVLAQAVEAAGGDWTRILADLHDHAAAIDGRLAQNATAAFTLGIAGTPAYLAGSVLVLGAQDERGFTRAFAEGRAAAQP